MRVIAPGTHSSSPLLQSRSVSRDCGVDPGNVPYREAGSGEIGLPFVITGRKSAPVFSLMINRIDEQRLLEEFDLIIIGGGINGCGIARDASERGLNVLLLEREDFGAGCSGVPSRLIHGGLRYLEYFELDLVRESLREREILLQNANHLVSSIKMSIPIYEGDKRGPFTVKIGMILYDILSFDKSLPRHRMMSPGEFMKLEPGVNSEGLRGAAVYYDAQVTYPERLCLENALMAKDYGAVVLNHAEVTDISINGDKVSHVEFVDRLSGKTHKARGKLVVNVSGPWVDELCGLTNRSCKKLIGGTVGSHIIIKKFENGPRNAVYASARSDKRPFFIIPWQNYYLIGTTDIPVNGDIDFLRISEKEISYLLSETNHIIKPRQITHDDILFSYTGVRPLPFVGDKRKNPASITRRHLIHDHRQEGINNLLSVIGGKLTTYRSLSEELVDFAYRKLGCNFVEGRTSHVPLIGKIEGDINEYRDSQVKITKDTYGKASDSTPHLIALYGCNYRKILDLTKKDPSLVQRLSPNAEDIAAQVVHSVSNEMACTVSDVLLRRTTLGLREGLGQDSIPRVSEILKDQLQFSNDEMSRQINEYKEKVLKLRKV